MSTTTTTLTTSPSSDAEARPSIEVETRPSATILPFPILRTETGRHIAAEYARRPAKGRYNRTTYADGVIKVTRERLERLGISQERIEGEVAALESLFADLSRQGTCERARA